nr:vegetative cell wall protein gp1-like isoform X2 [Odocoileus virginianus texanus]
MVKDGPVMETSVRPCPRVKEALGLGRRTSLPSPQPNHEKQPSPPSPQHQPGDHLGLEPSTATASWLSSLGQEAGSAAGPAEAPWSQVRSTLSHPAPTGQVGHRHGPCVESNRLQGEADVIRERPLCPSPYFLSPQPHWAGSSDLSKSLVPAEQRHQGSGPHPAPSSCPPHPRTWALNTTVLCVLWGFFRHHPAPAPWRQAVPSEMPQPPTGLPRGQNVARDSQPVVCPLPPLTTSEIHMSIPARRKMLLFGWTDTAHPVPTLSSPPEWASGHPSLRPRGSTPCPPVLCLFQARVCPLPQAPSCLSPPNLSSSPPLVPTERSLPFPGSLSRMVQFLLQPPGNLLSPEVLWATLKPPPTSCSASPRAAGGQQARKMQ